MVELIEITVSCITAIVLAILFGLFLGTNGTYIAFIIAGIIIGYISGGNYVEGLIYGGITGIVSGFFLEVLSLFLNLLFGSSGGFGSGILVGTLDITSVLYLILIYGIVSAIGGLISAIFREGIIKYR